MTKEQFVQRKNELMETNSKIIGEMNEPWEIAQQNGQCLCDLNRLIEEYTNS